MSLNHPSESPIQQAGACVRSLMGLMGQKQLCQRVTPDGYELQHEDWKFTFADTFDGSKRMDILSPDGTLFIVKLLLSSGEFFVFTKGELFCGSHSREDTAFALPVLRMIERVLDRVPSPAQLNVEDTRQRTADKVTAIVS